MKAVGLAVRTLSCTNFRSLSSRELAFSPALSVLVGPNASGKTNTVEALQLLTSGTSFRKPLVDALVSEGEEQARIAAAVRGDGRALDLMMDVAEGKRRFYLNGKPCAASAMPQTLMSVLFTPDDLWLVKRGASTRREEVDSFAKQVNVGYAKVLAAYTKAVQQRNRLLEEGVQEDLLLAWDEAVAVGGATLLLARAKLVGRLSQKMVRLYTQIGAGERLDCHYLCTLCDDPLSFDKKGLAELFFSALAQNRDQDLRRAQTCVGPHRDDLEFLIDGRSARQFASQGQQRSIALALKLAEVELAHEIRGSYPLLLLDDVMSELDEARRDAVVGQVLQGVQTVVTTTNLGYFSPSLLEKAQVIDYGKRD